MSGPAPGPLHLLVTGGAGYVGSACATLLIERGHRVTVLDDLSTGNRDAVPAGAEFVHGEVSADAAGVLTRMGERAPVDGVLHFAAMSLVGESVDEPASYWHRNVGATLALLDAMRDQNGPRLVFSSTAAVYGEPEQVPITEDAPTAPTNPYGATKLAVDLAITSYARAYGLGAVSLRYFNAAGADPDGETGEVHDPETHLIPLVLDAAAGKRPHITVFGSDYPTPDGTCIRDYIHVSDLADAHVLALHALLEGAATTAYNLGNGKGFSVREVIDCAQRVTGREIAISEGERRPGDPPVLVGDATRIRRELGWSPRLADLDTIIATAWRWHTRLDEGNR